MRTKHLLLQLLMLTCMASFAQPKADANDTSNKKASAPNDRNMFGIGVKRGLTVTTDGLTDGYVMFSVPNSASVYLINRKGAVVHEWKGNYGGTANVAYLMNDGSIMKNAVDPDFPVFAGGGEAGRIQKINWNNKMMWDFEYANEEALVHHDFAIMPNGHILAIAWEARTANEALAAGRKPKLIPKAGVWPDKIIEIDPTGNSGGKIVWQWHVFDHLIQDFDAKKANYGKPAAHPELLDFNVGDTLPPLISSDSMDVLKAQGKMPWKNQTPENMGADIYHFNAIKYNPELDQIVFSSPHLSEIFIIDHSTTTKEAAGHTGGRWGKGGDFLYRWGNPQNYQHGDSSTQKLFGQHDVRWIEKGYPGEGNLMVFNNDIHNHDKLNYSAVYELIPPVDQKGNFLLEKGKTFGPDKPVWKYITSDTVSFWSNFISGADRMKNGNTFINEGARGRCFEITKEGRTVWEYLNQYRGEMRKTNGDPVSHMFLPYSLFRATFIPADHPALANKKLDPIEPQPKPFVLPVPPATK